MGLIFCSSIKSAERRIGSCMPRIGKEPLRKYSPQLQQIRVAGVTGECRCVHNADRSYAERSYPPRSLLHSSEDLQSDAEYTIP